MVTWRESKKKLLLGIALMLLILFLFGEPVHKTNLGLRIITEKEILPVFIIIVCDDNKPSKTGSFSRQLNQVTVLLKSAASLTNETLRFLVVTNSDDVFKQIKSIPSAWPDKYRSRLEFESRSVWYPPDREDMRGLLRPCSSARLFLPESLWDIDAAVLVDTDTLFLRPPEELLREIYKFNASQAAGLAQTSVGYHHRRIPFPKPRGVNTGVMVMNMTRLRALPAGWTGTTLQAFDDHKRKLTVTATNDIINIALGQNIEIYYELDCSWNYGPGACFKGSNTCPNAELTGVHLLHGTSAAFVNNKNIKFRAVFEAWLNFKLGSPLTELLNDIRRRIQADTSAKIRCNRLTSLELMFTKSLEKLCGK